MAENKPESKPASNEEMAEAAELMDFAAGTTAAAGVAEVAAGMDTLAAAADVADVGRPARVGVHRQDVVGRPRVVVVDLVGPLLEPALLPAGLDLLRDVAISHGPQRSDADLVGGLVAGC